METEGNLTPITNKLWIYKRKFGDEKTNLVISRVKPVVKEARKTFEWKPVYQAKAEEPREEQNELQKKGVPRLPELVLEAEAKKASRQVKQNELQKKGVQRLPELVLEAEAKKASRQVKQNDRTKSSTLNVQKGRLMKKSRKEFMAYKQARPIYR